MPQSFLCFCGQYQAYNFLTFSLLDFLTRTYATFRIAVVCEAMSLHFLFWMKWLWSKYFPSSMCFWSSLVHKILSVLTRHEHFSSCSLTQSQPSVQMESGLFLLASDPKPSPECWFAVNSAATHSILTHTKETTTPPLQWAYPCQNVRCLQLNHGFLWHH